MAVSKTIMVSLAAVSLGAAAAGAYHFHRASQCAGLEDDLLVSVTRMRDAAGARASVQRVMKPGEEFDKIIRRHSDRVASTLILINDRCGKRAADTAERKASELLGL